LREGGNMGLLSQALRRGGKEMATLSRIELVSAFIAGLLGAAGLAYATFGPTYRSSTGATANLVQVNGPQVLWVILVLLLLVSAVPIGAYLHGRRHSDAAGLSLLWVGALLLAIARALTGFSIGGFIQPVAAFSLVAAVAGSLAGRHSLRNTAYGLALFWATSSLFYYVVLAGGDTLDRIGQSLLRGPLMMLAWLFDPRYLFPIFG